MAGSVKLVFVTVSGSGVVTTTPEPVIVTGSNVLINFRLVTEGWVFPDVDAITVDNPGPTFPHACWPIGPQSVGLLDTVQTKADFKYNVTVVHQATGQALHFDPTIRNQ